MVKAVESIVPVALSTLTGYAPSLPREVTVTFTDGQQAARKVTWEELDPELYQQPGVFTLAGTVEDTDKKAAAEITVIKRADAPVITVDACTLRDEESSLLPGQQLNAFAGNCGLQAEAARAADGTLYLLVANPTDQMCIRDRVKMISRLSSHRSSAAAITCPTMSSMRATLA